MNDKEALKDLIQESKNFAEQLDIEWDYKLSTIVTNAFTEGVLHARKND